MAKIVMVHGAFNELWGPHELKARWLPALRDGLWHHGEEISDDDVALCFYGDLFRRQPGSARDAELEQSRAGIAEAMSGLADGTAMEALTPATVMALVCTRPCVSVAGTRCTRCTPLSHLSCE